ncbi:MAG: tRNA (guanosine(46)-N7)-methyltransferase TrmB [Verrucomicrobiia bacterium]
MRILPLDILTPLDWNRVFPRVQPVEIDLGCGDGAFLVGSAQARPHHNFLGVERKLPRIDRCCRRCWRGQCGNVRVILIESGYLVRHMIPPDSVHTIHILFPDPWPKRKHERHRLLKATFFRDAARLLAPSGEIRLKTDDQKYFSFALKEAAASGAVVEQDVDHLENKEPMSDFEQRFRREGRPIYFKIWRRSDQAL